jgi:methionyl-tRNA formyltransferase
MARCEGRQASRQTPGEWPLRIAFFGTGEFGVPSLRALVAHGIVPKLVVSQPSRPKGRSLEPSPPPLAEVALELGLSLRQPDKASDPDLHAELSALELDAIIVIAYGQILRRKLLELPRLGCLNLHGSLLPKHRGASPIAAAILAGDAETGVTLMRMDEGLDSGPILETCSTGVGENEAAGSLHDRLAALGAPLLVSGLEKYLRGQLLPVPQDHAKATKCGLIRKEDGRLDFARPAAELVRRVRAYHPWPGAFFELPTPKGSVRLTVEQAESEPFTAGRPGTIRADSARLAIATPEGALRLVQVRAAGRKSMDIAAFLRGTTIPAGSTVGIG